MDLSYEVLNVDFGQGAAKILEVKVGGQKIYLLTRPTPGALVSNWARRQNFFLTSNFDF